jgi:hypothetical protein
VEYALSQMVRECIYFIQAASGEGPVKIGWTRDVPSRRLAALQAGSPVELVIVATIPGGPAMEAELHAFFDAYRRHGEWFDAPADQLRQIMFEGHWPVLRPVELDLSAAAPDPNDLQMTVGAWERRREIEQYYMQGVRESAIAAMLGWKHERLQKELRAMAKLGYFRGTRLLPRSGGAVRGLDSKRQARFGAV